MSSEHLQHPQVDVWLNDSEQIVNEYAEIASVDDIARSAWDGMRASIESHYYTERDGRALFAKWFGEATLHRMIEGDLQEIFEQQSLGYGDI